MKDILKAIIIGGLFAIPFLTLYVENDFFFPFITGKNFAFRIIVEVVLAAWVLLALLDARYRPRFSWLLSSFSVLIIVMFFANLFGAHPATGFWSNFERMDGYVTLVHVFLYVLVLGSMLKEKRHWHYYLYTTLAVAFFVSLHGLAQYTGIVEGYRGRIDGKLGNAAYMAIYMLFHTFIAFWMFVESRTTAMRISMALLSVMFIFTLVETGTRGTVLGLIAGIAAMGGYVALFGARFKQFRRYSVAVLVLLGIAAGTLHLARDSAFVAESPNLARIASVTSPARVLEELEIRFVIWGMAIEGAKERPLLGWGQGNFNFVFNEYYEPTLYGQEQWFDRVHNIVLDWLIAGGVLGLLAYLSIFVACGYYLFWRPFFNNDESFNVLERGVLVGILVGYFTHNLVVFDNIVSYIFFGVILALIHSRVGVEMPKVATMRIDERLVTQFAVPVMAVVVIGVYYTMHRPNMAAAGDIIDGYRATTVQTQYEAFERALSRDSFAQQEVIEQLAQQAMNVARDTKVPEELRQKYVARAESELLAYSKKKPNDARLHVFLGTFYRSIGAPDKAAEQMAIARTLSPRKQAIIAQQGVVELTRNNNEAARDFFKEAFELDERNAEAREYYAASLFYSGQGDAAKALIDSEATKERFAMSDFLINGVNAAGGDSEFLVELYTIRISKSPENAQNWASLAFLYYQMGDIEKALATLEEGGKKVPSFGKTASCISDNIKSGREPQAGCGS